MDIQLWYYPQALLLIVARILTIVGGSNLFGKEITPMSARVLISIALSMVIAPMVPEAWAETARQMDSLPKLAIGILAEVLFGFTFVAICDLFVGIFTFAGHIIGWSSSLMMAQEIDPVDGVNNNIMSLILQLVFLMLIWSHGAHLLVIGMIHKSFMTIPPTFAWLDVNVTQMIIDLGKTMFDWGMKITAPIVAGALLINAGMGLISKMAPQFNIMFLSMPIRVGTGMFMMGLFLRYGGGQLEDIIRSMLEHFAWLVKVGA
ncbi:MAG: type III secretion protein [Spartobacteria bacterium]|nr:type III secretion protein [Spartobacteria bacterium]